MTRRHAALLLGVALLVIPAGACVSRSAAVPVRPVSTVYVPGASAPPPVRSLGSKPPPNQPPNQAPSLSPGGTDLADPNLKEVAMQLLSSAENSGLDWRSYYRYIEDIDDGRGYTAGIVGFCSGTGDMLQLVERYTRASPRNRLAKYLPALRTLAGSDSHRGLDPTFTSDWVAAARDPLFQRAQDAERDAVYFAPALAAARQDGLRPLGQFAYFDATVMHGADGLAKLRRQAAATARTPARGGDEVAYLNAFLDARVATMAKEPAHRDAGRVETEQRTFLVARNLTLTPPLTWQVNGGTFKIPT